MFVSQESQQLKQTIEAQHGAKATLAQTVPVHECFFDRPNWEGVVHIFDLLDHPKATRAYAWSSHAKGDAERCIFSILQTDSVISPKDAVRAAVAAEHHVEYAPPWWSRSFSDQRAMGIRDWWSGQLGSEHQKLIDQCEAKATELLAAMTAANAVAPNVNRVRAIKGLRSFQDELARLKISMKQNGKLRPNETEALVIQMQKLNEAAALFSKANSGNA